MRVANRSLLVRLLNGIYRFQLKVGQVLNLPALAITGVYLSAGIDICSHSLIAAPFAYVGNRTQGSISIFDLQFPSKAPETIQIVPANPEVEPICCMALSPDGRKAYIGVFSPTPRFVVVNLVSKKTEYSVRLDGYPTSIAVSPDGKKAYVCVSERNTKQRKKKRSYGWKSEEYSIERGFRTLPNIGLRNALLKKRGSSKRMRKKQASSGAVAIVDLKRHVHIAPIIPVGAQPAVISISQDGERAYVCNVGSHGVSILDLAKNKVIATIPVHSPSAILLVPDVSLAYVCDYDDNTVYEVDVRTNTISTPPSPISGMSRPISVATTFDSKKIYVANYDNNTVSYFGIISGRVEGKIDVGGGPRNIVISPDGLRACVSNSTDRTVSVLDLTTNTVIGTLPAQQSNGVLAVGGIPGPKKFVGQLKFGRNKKNLFLKTRWKNSSALNIKEYELFVLSFKVSSVPATGKLRHVFHISPRGDGRTPRPYILTLDSDYKIRAVDTSGNVSAFVQLRVRR